MLVHHSDRPLSRVAQAFNRIKYSATHFLAFQRYSYLAGLCKLIGDDNFCMVVMIKGGVWRRCFLNKPRRYSTMHFIFCTVYCNYL